MARIKIDVKNKIVSHDSREIFVGDWDRKRELSLREMGIDVDQLNSLHAFEDSSERFAMERRDAEWAQLEINSANQRIRELNEELARKKEYVITLNRLILHYKGLVNSAKSKKRGRPARLFHREYIIKTVFSRWVDSLMASLEVNSCGAKGGLEYMLPNVQERTWRRWVNGESVPPYSTFDNLLDEVITSGKYARQPLFKIPVNPTHDQVLTMLQFM